MKRPLLIDLYTDTFSLTPFLLTPFFFFSPFEPSCWVCGACLFDATDSQLTQKAHMFTIHTMSPILDRIEKEAFQLSPVEREQLATHLFYSVHPVLTDVDEAWLDLADKRYQDLLSGKTSPLSENEFLSSIEKDLGWK